MISYKNHTQDIRVSIQAEGFAVIELAKPEKSNAFSMRTLQEISEALEWINEQADARAVILRGQGRHFCAGIELQCLASLAGLSQSDNPARAAASFRGHILKTQEQFEAFERCRWPIIAAIQGICIGGGVDIISACDIRCCSADAVFSIKEIDVGITADVGSLQRLPAIIGQGMVTELALTGRNFDANEAKAIGLVSHVLPDKPSLNSKAEALAVQLACKAPLALMGTKRVLLHARDNSVKEGLEYVATWNAGLALSNDMNEALESIKAGRQPSFSKL